MSMISRDMVVTRKVTLLKELDAIKGNMNAIHGALQDCEYWLSQLAEGEEEDKKV